MAEQAVGEKLKVKDGSDRIPVFIHSELDDYGLSPVEFRVYARVARRAGSNGKHSESIPNMASGWGIGKRTVQYALRLLTNCGLISRHVRPGQTNEYSLNPLSSWRDKGDLKKLRQQNFRSGGATRDRGAAKDRGVVQPEHGVGVQPETDEGTPFEGTPFEGTPKEIQQRAKRGDPPDVPDVPNSRGTRIPKDFVVTNAIREWARMKAPLVDVDEARDEFFDYWDPLPSNKARKLNWDQTFKNRLRDLQARAAKAVKSYGPRRMYATDQEGIRVSSKAGVGAGFKGSITG
jgi:hypothetical protein